MSQVYFVSSNIKKRTAKCLIYHAKQTRMPAFIGELCDALGVANKKRTAANFMQLVKEEAVPDNSYIMCDVSVRTSPEVMAMLQSSFMGFVGNLKEEYESICFENLNVWPLDNTKSSSNDTSFEAAQEHFHLSHLSAKLPNHIAPMVSVHP